MVLYGNVYDVTKFVPEHPGGAKIILQLAGQDATEEYDPVHPPGTLEEQLAPECKLGSIDESTLPNKKPAEEANAAAEQELPVAMEDILNLDEFEQVATKKISRKGWGYYYSAGDDLHSKTFNNTVYRQILLRPRIFIDCSRCDTSTSFLSVGKPYNKNTPLKVNLPIFVSPAAMARLGHPTGEHGIAQAAAQYGAVQIISNNASMTPEQIVSGAPADQIFGWQIYVQNDRRKSELMLERINKLKNIKFIVLTLDAPVPGKREDDERANNVGANTAVRSSITNPASQTSSESTTTASPASYNGNPDEKSGAKGGIGKAIFAGTAPDLTWSTTLPWLAKHTSLPIVLKGLQTHEDAYIASLHTPQVKAVILSNHGGRALDTAPPAIHTLLEIRKYCPEILTRLEVWVDGGIRRGTDVVKALCLGAKGVGVGRAALWSLSAGGPEGVARMFEILKAETETAMRLLGVERVEDLGPQHVNTRAVERDIYDGVWEKPVLQGLWAGVKAKL